MFLKDVTGAWQEFSRTQAVMMTASIYIIDMRDAGDWWEGGKGMMIQVVAGVNKMFTAAVPDFDL